MVSRNLVICDQEVRYAAALAEVFHESEGAGTWRTGM